MSKQLDATELAAYFQKAIFECAEWPADLSEHTETVQIAFRITGDWCVARSEELRVGIELAKAAV